MYVAPLRGASSGGLAMNGINMAGKPLMIGGVIQGK